MNNSQNRSILGILVILTALILPQIIKSEHLGIITGINQSLINNDSGRLLLTSTKLVFLNTLRAVPIYTGTFILAEEVYKYLNNKLMGFIIPLIIIPLVYKIITIIYGISYDFGGPAYTIIIVIIVLHQVTVNIKPIFIKIIIISLFLFGLQWLDIVPSLTTYQFGRGELSLYIKEVAFFLDSTYTLNFVGLTFAITIVGNALILAKVFIGHNNRLILLKEQRKKEEQLKQVEIEAVKSRYYKELKCLVHDLKTPLMTIQGLSDVIKIKSIQPDIKKYLDKIINSSKKMDQMISEILNNKKNRVISIKELFEFIEAQLSPKEINDKINFNYSDRNINIYGNKIRISRALINIITNSLKAIDKEKGYINISAKKINNEVIISVKDNGEGIDDDKLEKVWEAGYSTGKDNTGLGLNFVKEVIDEHEGEIVLSSEKGQGTKVDIILSRGDIVE